MALDYVTLTGTIPGGGGAVVTATLSGWEPDATDALLIPPEPDPAHCSAAGTFALAGLVANDNADIAAGSYWTITITGIPGVAPLTQVVELLYANGATQDISALAAYVPPAQVVGVMPLPTGTPTAGDVPVATGVGEASAWGSAGGGAVSSVFGRTGAVTARSGDYTAAQVGADASGAASTAQANAETYAAAQAAAAEAYAAGQASAAQSAAESFATSAISTETSRAEAAEALRAPLANPALTGTPTAPTATALADSTQLATTAYADNATGVEKARALAAEAILAPLQAAPANFKPANPTATASTTLVMMGLGTTCVYTPSRSGLVQVSIAGQACTNSAVATCTLGPRYGTGAAPANGAAVTGTRFGAAADLVIRPASQLAPSTIAFTDLLALTPGTAYWFDLAIDTSATADTAFAQYVSMTFVELP